VLTSAARRAATAPGAPTLLLVDDDPGVVLELAESLRERGYEVLTATTPRQALELATTHDVALVIADVVMPEMRGEELLRRIHEQRPEQLVMLMTAFGSIEQGVAAVRQGACDFIAKPFPIDALFVAVERALRERQMTREIVRLRERTRETDQDLVSRSPAMRRVLDLASRAAASDVTVLITGESGVGKGAVAQWIHRQSRRADAPFVRLNCAALPAPLAEAELFGVKRGAYTDARSDRDGLFVRASHGTLFLDEIGDLPLELQPKLLQALEARRIRAVGADEEVGVSTRLIAATNLGLEQSVAEGAFRADLFHRLNVVRIEIPPLRARMEDLPALVDHILPGVAERLGRPIGGVSASAMRWMMSYSWPGNVRELTNTIERAVALCEHDVLLAADVRPTAPPVPNGDDLDSLARAEASLAEVERRYVQRVLSLCDFNKARAARILGVDRRTLYRKLSE
jgi:DNA-binding NtrC family response regulator